MKKTKYIILLLTIIIFSIAIYSIAQTYSKYISTTGAVSTTNIAKWHIKVNNEHITSGNDISDTVTPTFPGNNHIKEGIIAPTAVGYFDLSLDFEEVDVSFKYLVSMENDENNVVDDLEITGYSMDEGANITPFTTLKEVEETITLNSTVTGRNIRIYIKWNDDSTATMDNEADTLTTTNPLNKASIKVTVAFTQITE